MITKNRLILILGLWIAFIPYSGFPSSFKTFFIVVSGLMVALFAFLLARDRHSMQRSLFDTPSKKGRVNDVYAESGPVWKTKENIQRENIGSVREENIEG